MAPTMAPCVRHAALRPPCALDASAPRQVTACVHSTRNRGGRAASSSRPARSVASAAHQLRGAAQGWGCANGARATAVWLDNTARVVAKGVPISLAFQMWTQKEEIPLWMPWIESVKVQADDPRMSKWCLSTEQFGQRLEFSWMARDLTPVPNQKIHWVSAGGLPNRGAVTFFPRGDGGCALQLSISYELPQILLPVGEGVRPVVEGILMADMNRFVALAQQRAATLK